MQFEARCRHPTTTCERLAKVKKKSTSSAVVYKFPAVASIKAMSKSGSLVENDSCSCTLASIATHRGLRSGSFWFIVGRPALGSVWLASDLSPAMLLFASHASFCREISQHRIQRAGHSAQRQQAHCHATRAAIGQPPIDPPLAPHHAAGRSFGEPCLSGVAHRPAASSQKRLNCHPLGERPVRTSPSVGLRKRAQGPSRARQAR